MKKDVRVTYLLLVGIGLALAAGIGGAGPVAPDQLPEPVANTFKTLFPNGVIEKLTSEEEFGVMVYDFEFRAGDQEKETDIAGDGTMLESTLVVVPSAIPASAMKTIKKVAKGAALGRMEWIERFYDLDAGKLIKLPKSVINYAVEMRRAGKMAEVFVDPRGKVTEAPVWVPDPAATTPGGKTGK